MTRVVGRILGAVACAAALSVTSGCASTSGGKDPLEPMNRAVFGFNDAVDRVVTKPLAQAWENYTPEILRVHVRNFFSNVGDVFNAVNNALQGKPVQALSDTGRVVVNTVFGFGGLVDIASDMGLEKSNEDFGQTFGRWGVPSGPYLVLPFLGPSSMRDSVGTALFFYADPIGRFDSVRARNSLAVTRVIDTRAQLLAAEKVVGGVALDRYSFIRDAYLQRRRNLVYDGDPPMDPEDDPGVDADAPKPDGKGAPAAGGDKTESR